jgi:surface antigen
MKHRRETRLVALALCGLLAFGPVAAAAETQPARHRLPPSLEGGLCHIDPAKASKWGLIIGAAIGGTIGAGASKDEDRAFGTALGAVIGAFVGKKIAEALSDTSRACISETLQYAADNQTIAWHDGAAMLDYRLTPIRSYDDAGKSCRTYVIEASSGSTSRRADGRACRTADSVWQILE